MRPIDLIVVHCSDSDHAQHDNLRSIRQWHVDQNKWSDIGYHIVITKAHMGRIHFARPIQRVGSHAKGFNKGSIGICITGKKVFSRDQIESLVKVCQHYMAIFDLKKDQVVGHYELNGGKTCPNIDMEELRRLL